VGEFKNAYLRETVCYGDMLVNGRMLLTRLLKKQEVRGPDLCGLEQKTVMGYCEHGNELFCSHKGRGES
jgi:hypothetical protein